MKTLQFFFECPFNQDEQFCDLDWIIQNYKNKEDHKYLTQLVADLHEIIQTQNYILASDIMQKSGNRKLNDLKEVEKFIHFLYDRFTNSQTSLKAEDFVSMEYEPLTMFKDRRAANTAVQENLKHNAEKIAVWITNNSQAFNVFEFKHTQPVGYGFLTNKDIFPYTVENKGIAYDLYGSRMVLEIDPSQDLGFKIITTYPIKL